MINICLATDDNYAPHAAALVASIMENKADDDRLAFYILSDRISERNKGFFRKMRERWGFEMEFIEMNDDQFQGLPKWGGGYTAYYRISINRLLPEYLHKILYLDCDMIVKKSLKPLYETELRDRYAAVVAEGDGRSEEYSHLDIGKYYFNSGMILFNLDKYRDDGMEERLLKRGFELRDVLKLPDQDLLNELFRGEVVWKPLAWNQVLSPDKFSLYDSMGINHCYSETEISEAMNDPAIIHYVGAGSPRPWLPFSRHYRKADYWKYLRATPFYKDVFLKYPMLWLRATLKWTGRFLCDIRWNRKKRFLRLCGITLISREITNDRSDSAASGRCSTSHSKKAA